MTSTENIKKVESDGEQEPERQEDGSNGADYRGVKTEQDKDSYSINN